MAAGILLGSRQLCLRALIVLIAAAAIFYWLQFTTPALIGEDGHYHTRMAQLVRDHGPLHEFPWMAFGLLKDTFSDKDFLFHWLRSRIAAQDEVWTSKVFTVACAALIFFSLYVVLVVHDAPLPTLWLLLTFGSGGFWLMRLLYFRPHLLEILFFILALEFIVSRRHVALCLLSVAYALAHVSAFIVVGLACVWTVVAYGATRRWEVRGLLASVVGVAAGFLIHPNFPANVSIWYVQIVQTLTHAYRLIGASDLNQGMEFWPVDGRLLIGGAPLPLLLLVLSLALLWSERPRWRPDSVFLALVAIGSFGAFLLSRRFMELWAPAQILACAFLVRDWRRHWTQHEFWTRMRGRRRILLTAVVVVIMFHDVGLSARMRAEAVGESRSPFDADYRGIAGWLDKHLPPGEIVYNANWGAFVYLFDYAPRLRYIVGLDPVFFHAYNRDLADLYNRIASGQVVDRYMWQWTACLVRNRLRRGRACWRQRVRPLYPCHRWSRSFWRY